MKRRTVLELMLALAGTGCATAPARLRDAPVDAMADARTRAQYAWLRATWGRQTIAGQQDLSWDDGVDMAQRVFADTGHDLRPIDQTGFRPAHSEENPMGEEGYEGHEGDGPPPDATMPPSSSTISASALRHFPIAGLAARTTRSLL